MKLKIIIFSICLFIGFLIILLPFIYVTYYPVNKEKKEVEIPKNLSTKKVCYLLQSKEVIPSAKILELMIKLSGKEKFIKYGFYVFPSKISYYKIFNILITGKQRLIKFTIPEGFNLYQIAELLEKKGFFSKKEFLDFCFNKEKIKIFLNNGISMEGYLYPDSYIISKATSVSNVVKVMNDNFKKKIVDRFYMDIIRSKFSLNETIILASIIQKETYYKKEMPIIASVFINRLKRGMRLQSDPTVIYGIWKEFKGKLTKKELNKYTPYNTYKINGLPLTPICNPGYYAVYSVLHPAKTNYLYFVSTNKGYHVFSKTYREHLKKVNIYQR